MKKAFIYLADGFEETEAIATIDILRRGEVDVRIVSITGNIFVSGAHKVTIQADSLFEDETFTHGNMVILPGGMPGTRNLQACKPLGDLLKEYNAEGKYIAAICAAPVVPGSLGMLEGKNATCYPGFESEVTGAKMTTDEVVVDGNFITSRGVGTVLEFALKLVEIQQGKSASEAVRKAIVMK